ncbi:MAG: VOC family protein [Candidatus Promineifilaceae bacterium]|nr:VOC family protein [Candidatus Promineifilaceae bacterium]
MSLLPDETELGRVALTVRNLEEAVAFYQDTIGLNTRLSEGDRVLLGTSHRDLIELVGRPAAPLVRGMTGLFHLAIRVSDRLQLGMSLRRLIETGAPLQGFADHLVSEAIYLSDPEGNGIEIYRDRPRHQWPRRNGQLLMGTESLAVEEILEQPGLADRSWNGLDDNAVIGHIHLPVDDLQAAESFYTEMVGFDLVMRYGPAAGFVSAGGYHHHIGYNTWAGVGAPRPPRGAAGLRWYTLRIPDQEAFEAAISRLRSADFAPEKVQGTFQVQDPAGNAIRLLKG